MSAETSHPPTITPLPGSPDFVPALLASAIIPKVNKLIDLPTFKLKIACRDFHPETHISFAESHKRPVDSTVTIYHPDDVDQLLGIEQVLWPIHNVAYTGGADFAPGLAATKFDYVLHKGTDPNIHSYSAFQDIWGRHKTELPDMLRKEGVTDLFNVGIAGDYCVKYTAKDAVDFGLRSWIVTDAVKGSPDCIPWDMINSGVKLTQMEDVLKKLQPKVN